MPKQSFQPRVACEMLFRAEVPWAFIGGRNFPVIEALFKNGVIDNQAWRVGEDGIHFCIFYFREEADADKFVRAVGGSRI